MMRVLAGLVVIILITGSAVAQDVTAKAAEAESLAREGKFIEAIAILDEAAITLWEKAPLTFRRALWVAQLPDGFGAFNPRENNVFDSGAKMIAYVEPVGFGWRKDGDIWMIDLVFDFIVRSKDGEELARQAAFQRLQLASRVRNREFMAHFTYTFTGLAAGEYVVETILRDEVTGKSGSFSPPITVR